MSKCKECTNKLLTALMIVCVLLSVVILGIISYDRFFKEKDEEKVNTESICPPVNNATNSEVDSELLGTYYFSDDETYYFTLKEDGHADVVESSCGEGALPLKTVSYKVMKSGNAVILELDINDNKQFESVYVGTKTLNRYYPTSLGCMGTEDSYYVKK